MSKINITLYGRKGHAYTVAFKNFLNSTDVPYIYKDVALDEDAKKHTKELYDGAIKYPTLIVNDEIYLTPTTEEFNKIMQDLNLRA